MKTWKLETVHDTREWEHNGKGWSAVAGSGVARECDHCGRSHEIHCTIYQPSSGMRIVVGSTCAKVLCWNTRPLNTQNLMLAFVDKLRRGGVSHER